MGQYMEQVPESIRDHLRDITRSSGMPAGEESEELIAKGWLEKKSHFEEQIGRMHMEEIDHLAEDDERGFLAMTYSGSLLNVGPLVAGKRKADYTSIGLRQDVPASAEREGARLDGDVAVEEVVSFVEGPIKSSSPVFKIAVFEDPPEADEQERQLALVTEILTEEFVDVNKTLMLE